MSSLIRLSEMLEIEVDGLPPILGGVPYWTSHTFTISRRNWIWEIFSRGRAFQKSSQELLTLTSTSHVKSGHHHFFPRMAIRYCFTFSSIKSVPSINSLYWPWPMDVGGVLKCSFFELLKILSHFSGVLYQMQYWPQLQVHYRATAHIKFHNFFEELFQNYHEFFSKNLFLLLKGHVLSILFLRTVPVPE